MASPTPFSLSGSLRIAICASLILLASPASHGAEFNPANPLNRAAPLFWCADRTVDQQYASEPEPGCAPLISDEDREKVHEARKKDADRAPIRIERIQDEASGFVRDYARFLDCCAADVNAIDELDELEVRSIEILIAIQESGLINAAYASCLRNCRGITTSEIIRSIVQARMSLGALKKRLTQLSEAIETVDTLDYMSAGRTQHRIEREKEAIGTEFRYRSPPSSAPTGMEIEDTTLGNRIGSQITDTTLPNAFGPDIGYVVSPDADPIGELAPRTGLDTQNTSLPTRAGTAIGGGNTPPTTLPNTIGFEIGTDRGPTGLSTTPARAGPAIGDSTFNQQR